MSDSRAASHLPWWEPQVGLRERELVNEVLADNYINDGNVTRQFEQQLARRLGVRHAVAVTSGTAALFLSLAACDVGPGDEVLVPDITFVATASAVRLAGATPVLVDVNPSTFTICPDAARKAMTPRTAAIMPVHISGRGAEMPSLRQLADEFGVVVIEDAAEALMSRQHGRCLGTWGRLGAFSFSPNKTITTGQGGLVVTDDDGLCERLRALKDQGRPVQGTGGDDAHPSLGFNFKLTNLQAAVGVAQLTRLDERIERMRRTWTIYRERLDGMPGLRFPGFTHEEIPQWVDVDVEDRNGLDDWLRQAGMDCRRFWHPVHRHPPYRADDARFPRAMEVASRGLWLPSSFTLTDDDVHRVCDRIREFRISRAAA